MATQRDVARFAALPLTQRTLREAALRCLDQQVVSGDLRILNYFEKVMWDESPMRVKVPTSLPPIPYTLHLTPYTLDQTQGPRAYATWPQ